MSALLALVSAAVFGAADFAGGFATRRLPVLVVTLCTSVVGVVLALGLVLSLDGTMSARAVGWGAVGGLCGLVGIVALYGGLATGPNRVVSPLSAVIAAVIPALAGLSMGERPGTLALVGLALTPPAVWFVAGGDVRMGTIERRALVLAVLAGIGFGFFFVGLAQTPDDSGAVPLLGARAASTAVLCVAVVVAVRARRLGPVGRGWGPFGIAVAGGALDMAANGLFLLASRDGDLAVVGALVSFYPVTTVLLATALLGERLERTQTLGLGLAVAAASLMS